MSKRIGFIFPGQGAQYPGMGRDFFDQFPTAKAVFTEADALLGRPFSELIFHGPKEELTETKNSQLAIFIMSIAILRCVQELLPELTPSFCGGLSLGEYSALVAAEKLSFADALAIVEVRGQYMQEACESHPGTMYVVLGMEKDQVEETLEPLSNVWIANLNCPGQIVISGTHVGCETAAQILKEKGARRVMPLDVSGGFHSGLMQTAQDHLSPMIEKAHVQNSSIGLVMNVSGGIVSDPKEMKKQMTPQVTHPVLWQSCIETMAQEGVDLFIEMGPGKTLAGMNKRIGIQVQTLSVEKVEDLNLLGVSYATSS